MLVRELINQTIRMKDEVKQRQTICQMGLITMKRELNDIKRRWDKDLSSNRLEIETKTDFKEMKITNQKQRDAYVLEAQTEMREEMIEEVIDQEVLIADAEEREKQLWDEYRYYEDRLEFLLKVYDFEGEIELEESIKKDREVLRSGTDEEE